ncbi:MAG: FecR family protein [Verrucomicrobiota bacterium]
MHNEPTHDSKMKEQEWIDQSFDDRLSEEDWVALQERLLKDPELLSAYVEQRWLHAELIAGSEALEDIEIRTVAGPPSWIRWSGWLAAALAVAILILGLLSTPQGETVATLIDAENCRWEGSELPTQEGARLGPGRLALAEGMATIRFDSGAEVTLEAPTVLEVASSMSCQLVEGSVVADVPDSAHGFTIDTEKLEVIDLGTRFGVTSTPVGGSHVFVFDGEVKVYEEESETAKHVLGGKSIHFGIDPEVSDAEEVLTQSLSIGNEGWIPVPTSFGRGKDTFIRREHPRGHGNEPLLMVKHTELAPGNERRAMLRFDFSGVNRLEMEEVKLALKLESSGLGFSSLVPDSEFAVYGFASENEVTWSEEEASWRPGNLLTSNSLEEEGFIPLASFLIAKGTSNEIIEVSSESLTEYILKRESPLVSLFLVRRTGEFDKQGLVHAFASKEHPSSPAPTLWFQPRSRR